MWTNVHCSSLVIDMNCTGSHACCPHTRNIVVPLDLINLNSELCRSEVCMEHMGKLKKEKQQRMTAKFIMKKKSSFHLNSVNSRIALGVVTYVVMHHSSYIPAKHSWKRYLCHVWTRQQSAVCPADKLRAEHQSRTFFSCNNAITRPRATDTGERRQQPRHAKY